MKKLIVASVLLIMTLMSTVIVSVKQVSPIHELYVFGDSLSDTGTVFRTTGGLNPPNPPYFQGRYSNGRVWVEYLADQISVNRVNNFAWGGATTKGDDNTLVPGLLAQVQSFVEAYPAINPDALYVLWAGANDYLQGETNPERPVANIAQAIELLIHDGATRILIANLPDLGRLPATQNNTSANQLTALTQAHNSSLRRSLKVLNQQYSELALMTLDANALYQEAISNPAMFGFTQVRSACLIGVSPCSNPNQHLFWDSIHPTTAGHRILGDAAVAVLESQSLFPNVDGMLRSR